MGQKKSLHNKYYNHIQVCIVPGTTCCKFKYSVVSYQTLEITFLENLFMIMIYRDLEVCCNSTAIEKPR